MFKSYYFNIKYMSLAEKYALIIEIEGRLYNKLVNRMARSSSSIRRCSLINVVIKDNSSTIYVLEDELDRYIDYDKRHYPGCSIIMCDRNDFNFNYYDLESKLTSL